MKSHVETDDRVCCTDSHAISSARFVFPGGNFELSGQVPLLAGFWQMMVVAGPYNLTRYGQG